MNARKVVTKLVGVNGLDHQEEVELQIYYSRTNCSSRDLIYPEIITIHKFGETVVESKELNMISK